MPLTIPAMIAEMHQLRDTLEKGVVGAAAVELQGIFGAAEVALAKQEKLFQALLTDADGKIQNIPANLEFAGAYYRDTVKPQIESVLVGPGKAWSEKTVPLMHKAGRRLASVNLDVGDLSPELVKNAFDNISIAEKGVLTVGFKQGYQVMNTVGDDVGTWFRQTMLDSVVEGIPVDHYNPNVDSLKSRLIQGGRIRPLTIKSMSGKTIHRSIRQRAQAIARIESTRIINRTHEALAEETLGDEAVFRNSNPQDSRSTRICWHASTQKAMSLEQWDNSRYGRPPRLSPFHLCRSVLIAGRPEWFDDVPEEQLQGAGLAKTKNGPTPWKTPRATAAEATARAAQEALQEAATLAAQQLSGPATVSVAAATAARLADLALARNTKAAIQDRLAAYGRTTGDAKIAQIKALEKHQAQKGTTVDVAAEIKALEGETSDGLGRLTALAAEEDIIIVAGDLRRKFPSLHNRRQAVPRLQEITKEIEAIVEELAELKERRAVLLETGKLAEISAGVTDQLRAEVIRVLRTEGDGMTSAIPQPRQLSSPSGVQLDRFNHRQAAAEAVEEGRDFVAAILDPTATTTGAAQVVEVKWIKGRAHANRGILRRVDAAEPTPHIPGETSDDWVARVKKARDDRVVSQDPHRVNLTRDNADSVGLEGTSTAVHEYGHTVEYATEASGLSKEFFRYRAGPEASMKTMNQWGFDWYSDPQLTNPDKFQDVFDSWAGKRAREMAHYTGKQYGRDSTEILAMGLEAFYRDPIGFVTKDPEWARYLFGVLDGGYKPQ